jgi:hypothetical protein
MAFEDDRQHLRYPISATAVISVKDVDDAVPFEAVVAVANISKSGLGLYSYASLQEGARLALDITFIAPNGAKVKDSVEGRVVWASELGKLDSEGRLHFIGLALDEELNSEKHPFLYEHLETKSEYG